MIIKHNYKTLAIESGLGYKSFLKEVNTMLSDPDIKSKFGKYRRRQLTKVQLNLLIDNISFLEHLKTNS